MHKLTISHKKVGRIAGHNDRCACKGTGEAGKQIEAVEVQFGWPQQCAYRLLGHVIKRYEVK